MFCRNFLCMMSFKDNCEHPDLTSCSLSSPFLRRYLFIYFILFFVFLFFVCWDGRTKEECLLWFIGRYSLEFGRLWLQFKQLSDWRLWNLLRVCLCSDKPRNIIYYLVSCFTVHLCQFVENVLCVRVCFSFVLFLFWPVKISHYPEEMENFKLFVTL